MKNSQSKSSTLRKVLSTYDGIAILVGITIGAGIYSTPQIIAGYMESFNMIIILWLLVGAFVFIGGLIYAELGSSFPETGGEYIYISRTFGPFAGFIFGWTQIIIIRTSATAGLSIIAVDYLGFFFTISVFTKTIVALLIIAILGTVNYVGIKQAGIFQKLSTLIKVAGLLILIIAGLFFFDHQTGLINTAGVATKSLGPVGNAIAAVMLIIFAHTGWDRVGYAAGEMKNPKKTIPATMFIGISIIVVLYILINVVYYNTLGISGLRESSIVASDTAIKLMGSFGAAFIAALVIISTMGSINGTMMTAPRVYYAMARDGLFFKWLDYVHSRHFSPSRAILAHCVWSAVILLFRGQFESIATGMVFAVLIFYAMNTLVVFKLRKNKWGQSSYKVPFFPVLPAIFFTGILLLLVFRVFFEWEKSLVDLAFIASGVPIALIWIHKNR